MRPEVARTVVFSALSVARQEAAAERAGRYEPDPELAQHAENAALEVPLPIEYSLWSADTG